MALIDCSECGHAISDRAFTCPKCGNPQKFNPRKKWEFITYSLLLGALGANNLYAFQYGNFLFKNFLLFIGVISIIFFHESYLLICFLFLNYLISIIEALNAGIDGKNQKMI